MIVQQCNSDDIDGLRREDFFILLDSGRRQELLKTLYMRHNDLAFVPVLPLARFGDAVFSGPIIVKSKAADNISDYFFSDPYSGILLNTNEDIAILAKYCFELMDQEIDGDSIFLRVYDSRVLSVLLNNMNNEEEDAFFSHILKKIYFQTADGDLMQVTPSRDISANSLYPKFKITTAALARLEEDHLGRKMEMIGSYLDEACLNCASSSCSGANYAKLTHEEKIRQLAHIQRHASMYSISEFDELKEFALEFTLCEDMLKKSPEAGAILSNMELTPTQKISYLYNFRMFKINPSPFFTDPVAILARSDLYAAFPGMIDEQGYRLPVNFLDSADTLARMYYCKACRAYRELSEAVYTAAADLFKGRFAVLNQTYDIYAYESAVLENAFSAALKTELAHV